jgi:type IX secretion system PorP/SprF family membrane protein
MRKRISILLFCSTALALNAQQMARFSHEFYKPMIFNPAFTGSEEALDAMIISRAQWIDFRNSPQQNIFTLDGALPDKKMALGIDLLSDRRGISRKTGGDLFYCYRLKLGESSSLSFGVSLGILDHTLFYSEAVLENSADPVIEGTSQRETSINGNAGLRFNWKGLDLGAACPQLLGNALEFQDGRTGKAYYALSRHYLGTASYRITLSETKKISLVPAAAVHFLPNAPLYYDANLNFDWKDKFWIGGTYKSEHAVAANAGFCIAKRLRVGYSYDIIIGKIGGYSGMSHEIMLNYIFGERNKKEELPEEVAVQPSKDKERADSLQTELEIKDNKVSEKDREIARLKTENESVKKKAAEAPPQENKEPAVVTTPDKSPEVITTPDKVSAVQTGREQQYVYADNNRKVKKGFYIITGAFVNRNFADDELRKLHQSGYRSSRLLFLPEKGLHYVAASVHGSKEDAVEKLNKLKSSGIKEAWILSIGN